MKIIRWGAPEGSHASEYSIRDLRVTAVSEFGRVMTVTLQTPNSNDEDVDHTVIKRWDFNVPGAAPDQLPEVITGYWILAGDVTIPVGQSVTVEAAASLNFAPGAKLIVEGTLTADGTGSEIMFKKGAEDQSD